MNAKEEASVFHWLKASVSKLSLLMGSELLTGQCLQPVSL